MDEQIIEPHIILSTNCKVTISNTYCYADTDGSGHCMKIIDGYSTGKRWAKQCIKCGFIMEVNHDK